MKRKQHRVKGTRGRGLTSPDLITAHLRPQRPPETPTRT
jgi:hypothetical protein